MIFQVHPVFWSYFSHFLKCFLGLFFVFSVKVLARFLKCFLASVESYNAEKIKEMKKNENDTFRERKSDNSLSLTASMSLEQPKSTSSRWPWYGRSESSGGNTVLAAKGTEGSVVSSAIVLTEKKSQKLSQTYWQFFYETIRKSRLDKWTVMQY